MHRLALIALGLTAHGEKSATVSVGFSANVVPVNQLAWQQEGDIIIVDALAFGKHYHRAFVVEGGETVTATAEGIRLLDKSDIALAYGGHGR